MQTLSVSSNLHRFLQTLAWVQKQPEYKSASKEDKVKILNLMTNTKIRNYDAQKYVYVNLKGHSETDFEFKQDVAEKLQIGYNNNQKYLKSIGITKADIVDFYKNGYNYHESYQKDNNNWYRDFKASVCNNYLLGREDYTAEQRAALYDLAKSSTAKSWDGVTPPSSSSEKRRSSGRKSRGSASKEITTSNIKASSYKVTSANYKSMAGNSSNSKKVFTDELKITPKIKLELIEK